MNKKQCLMKKYNKYSKARELCEKLAEERLDSLLQKIDERDKKNFKIKTHVHSDGDCSIEIRWRRWFGKNYWSNINSVHEDDDVISFYENRKVELLGDDWEDSLKDVVDAIDAIKNRARKAIPKLRKIAGKPKPKPPKEPPKETFWKRVFG